MVDAITSQIQHAQVAQVLQTFHHSYLHVQNDNIRFTTFCLRAASPAGNRQPIPADPLPAVSYK